MDALLEKLEQILQSELEMHRTLVASAKEFNRGLKEEDVDLINRQRSVHDETVHAIGKLEEQRNECCLALARTYGITRKPLRIAFLLDKVPEQWRERLAALRTALKEKVGELSKLTTSNRILLEEGLRMINATFTMIRDGGRKYAAYGNRGQSTKGSSLNALFNRTV